MKTSHFLFIILLIISLNTSAIAPNTSALEQKLGETVDIVENTRKSGVEVNDLVLRIDNVIEELNICGWAYCSNIVKDEVTEELNAIQTQAIDRRRVISNELSISILIVVLIIAVYLAHRKYDLVHRTRWYLYKNRRIKYE